MHSRTRPSGFRLRRCPYKAIETAHDAHAPTADDGDEFKESDKIRFQLLEDIFHQDFLSKLPIDYVERVEDLANPRIPAGYTYLGQLIAHDLAFHDFQRTSFDRREPVPSFPRSVSLDLDCIYGGGPNVRPWLYCLDGRQSSDGTRLLLGRNRIANAPRGHLDYGRKREDIPRVPSPIHGTEPDSPVLFDPLVADPRNDENLILSQLTVFFIKLHNAIVDRLERDDDALTAARQGDWADRSLFELARHLTGHCYRMIVVEDYCDKVLDGEVRARLLSSLGLGEADVEHEALCLPDEDDFEAFWAAAFRVGHAMIDKAYQYNRTHTDDAHGFQPAFLEELLDQTDPEKKKVPITEDWIIDWSRFFFDPQNAESPPSRNLSRRFIPRMVNELDARTKAEDCKGNLAYRDLARAHQHRVPNGQVMALKHDCDVLAPQFIDAWANMIPAEAPGRQELDNVGSDTPLLFYILCESSLPPTRGLSLGPLGSTILAKVFLSALAPFDLAQDEALFKRTFGTASRRSMQALIEFERRATA